MKIIQENGKYKLSLTKKEWISIGQNFNKENDAMSDTNPRKKFNDAITKLRDFYDRGIVEEGRDRTYSYEITDSTGADGTKYIQIFYDYWKNIISVSKYYESEQMQNHYGETFKFTNTEDTEQNYNIIKSKIDEFLL